MIIAKYRPDMFINCPDGTPHSWDRKNREFTPPANGMTKKCIKCGKYRARDTSD